MQNSDIKSNLEQHHKDCYGWALHCCNQEEEMAREILQNAYLKMLERQHTFKGKSEFRTWAFTIIKNTATDAQRKRKREMRIIPPENNVPDRGYQETFETAFEQERTKVFFEKALSQLSDRQQQILQLVFYHDLSLNQAAEILQISPGSVRKHYDRAKKILAVWFQKKGIIEL